MASGDRLDKLTRAELAGMLLSYNYWFKRTNCTATRKFLKARIEEIKKILEEK